MGSVLLDCSRTLYIEAMLVLDSGLLGLVSLVWRLEACTTSPDQESFSILAVSRPQVSAAELNSFTEAGLIGEEGHGSAGPDTENPATWP